MVLQNAGLVEGPDRQDISLGQRCVVLGVQPLAPSADLLQLFKHHQSVLTGHLKMMDMVRKHCIEGTGNYETAKACVDRTHEMMRMFKQATFNFVCLIPCYLESSHHLAV